ncbi:MAG: hypothetical protein HN576_05930 [Bacteriovoracaceae bacterium]|jgi:hypothetical protein|nr:hypothetical protein [Bacteriovoracaceae bacterium]
MKGTFFLKPLEFNIDIFGESFEQGQILKGNMALKKHGPVEGTLSNYGVTLAIGDNKKIKKKDVKAFITIDSKEFSQSEEIEDQQSLEFSFQLDANCPITTKASSLYLLCGPRDDLLSAGALELNIIPNRWLQEFIDTLVLFFRFKLKAIKSKKDLVEYKLQAPDTKEFGAIEQLLLSLRKDGDNIQVFYQFKVKKLCYEQEGVVAKDEIIKIEQSLTPKDYKQFGDSPNQNQMKLFLNEALEQIKRKTLL